MFPRTRRCLTGTHTRPIVTARASKLPRPSTVPTWSRYQSAVAPKEALSCDDVGQNPHNQAPATNDTRPPGHETKTRPRNVHDDPSRSVVGQLMADRISRLPRSNQLIIANDSSCDSREGDSPTFQTARARLGLSNNGQGEKHKGTNDTPLETLSGSRRPYSSQVDWLPLARFLATIPKPQSESTQASVELDRTFLSTYTGSYRPNVWTENVGTGVLVELAPESGFMANATRPAVLTGSPYYEALVRDKLSGSVEAEDASQGLREDDQFDSLANVISVSSFTRLVYRLTNQYINRNVEKDAYHDYHRYAADILSWMFEDPVTSRYASTVALNRALIFLYNHPELAGTATLIFDKAQRMSLVYNTTTANLRLGFGIRHNFRSMAQATAKDMMDYGIQPNSRTWSILYTALSTSHARLQLINLIQDRNIKITDKVWSQFASTILEERLRSNSDDDADVLAAIVTDVDEAIGPSWLTTEACHRALSVCRDMRAYNIAQSLTELADSRGVAVRRDSHVISFALFRRRKDLDSAVKLLTAMSAQGDLIHAKWVIPYMFMTAWYRQRLYTCHLLWIFAATCGLITKRMRTVVNRALLSNTPGDAKLEEVSRSQLRRSRWRQMAARVICGIDDDFLNRGTDFGKRFPRLHAYCFGNERSSRHPDVAEMLMHWTPDDGTRDEQLSLAYVVIGHDINAWKTFDPMTLETLIQQLPLANARDREPKDPDELTGNDVNEVRRASRRALQGCIPQRAGQEFSPRVGRIRETVLRNLAVAGLSPERPTQS